DLVHHLLLYQHITQAYVGMSKNIHNLSLMLFRTVMLWGNSMPVVDQQQNYKLLSLNESDGKTVMKFQRSIEACDENDLPITNLPMKLIYAYGQTDDITYHSTRRGRKELNLLKYMPRVNPPNSKYFDMTMVNFTVPTNQTHYHCKIMRALTFDRKQHIYRIEPVITNFDLVHHLLLYRCPLTVTEPFEAECYTPFRTNLCMETIAVWGVGGGAFEFPEVAGLPIGGNVGDFLYRLEVHYNNVNKSTGRVDNSGLRFYYTSRSLQVNAVVYFRGGKQIDFLAVDENYDFEYQDVMNLGKTKTVKLGDKLLVECTYNTENRSTLTWGGLSTSDEMCLAFLFYYPAMNLSGCMSFPNTTTLRSEMGTPNSKIDQLVIIADSLNNISRNTGLIPDLSVIPSAPCMSGCATKSLALLSLLLCLAVQFMQKYY
uniref:Monooxygenase, DBH-like 1, like n=1 Tax=Sinocyclocheilus rhinocerous TaxID=307959 RepID=A0A673IL13_9TELE